MTEMEWFVGAIHDRLLIGYLSGKPMYSKLYHDNDWNSFYRERASYMAQEFDTYDVNISNCVEDNYEIQIFGKNQTALWKSE